MRNNRYKFDAVSVKEQIDPYDFYLREQLLDRYRSRSGAWAVAGLCPFHADSSAGSFKVNVETGAFTCFSCGAKGGDILSFTQQKYGLQFPQAIEHLVNEWGAR